MKRLTAVALMVAGFALPVCAQRSESHGGFSSHAGQGFHGGSAASSPRFSGSAPSRVSGAHGFAPNRSQVLTHGPQRRNPGNPVSRQRNPEGDHHRMPYRPHYGAGVPYVYSPWMGGLGPGYLGYPDDSGYDNSQAAPGDATGDDTAQDYEAQPTEQDQPDPRPPYPATADLPQPSQQNQEAVTLVFKDGRPTEQVHNYILTTTTLFIQDQLRRTIPIAQLDLVATAKANQEAGVEFQLPSAAR